LTFKSDEEIPVIARDVDVACARVVFPNTVSVPWARKLPVVVAPPLMVRPPVCVPLPIVVEARERRPLLKVMVVEVALLGNK
jgi:hypothetical protein